MNSCYYNAPSTREELGAILDWNCDETQELVDRVKCGQEDAFEELFNRHRLRLRRAIALRMDQRLAARADASDILQETYLEAMRRLPRYLEKPSMPFYLWLRWIAREKILTLYRRHMGADKRAVDREVPLLPADSSKALVVGIIGDHGPTPSQALAAAEMSEILRKALDRLDQEEREIILWRHFEQLTAKEMAQLLEITEAAASKRYIRALERLRGLLKEFGLSKP